MVLAKWLNKEADLTLLSLNLIAFIEFVRIKVGKIHGLYLKKGTRLLLAVLVFLGD